MDQLTFVFSTEFQDPTTVRGGGWLQTIVPVTFGQQARELAPSFKAPFGTVPALTVSVDSSTALRAVAGQRQSRGASIRARPLTPPSPDSSQSPIICSSVLQCIGR